MIKRLFPFGKAKAFVLSYDDGVVQDIRLVELINKYNLKATFNLNSALMENEFEWTHEKGCVIKRLSPERASELYKGFEIASHTRTHPYMENLTEAEIMTEMAMDKQGLEKLFNTQVRGFAVPFDYYSELIERCAINCGFEYVRTSEESRVFSPCRDYFRFSSTIFHLDANLTKYISDFIQTQEELAVCQLVGHSYEFDTENMWDVIEDVFSLISRQNDILPMTNIELVCFLKEMDKADITDKYIHNSSTVDLYFNVGGNIVCLHPNEQILL